MGSGRDDTFSRCCGRLQRVLEIADAPRLVTGIRRRLKWHCGLHPFLLMFGTLGSQK